MLNFIRKDVRLWLNQHCKDVLNVILVYLGELLERLQNYQEEHVQLLSENHVADKVVDIGKFSTL
nr:MAG TPA: hypothetical protein [Caudoviricetes sp.]